MIKVVHITAHLGGGVGKILSAIAIYSKSEGKFEHTIVTLEPTLTVQFEVLCKKHNIEVLLAEKCNIENILEKADIIQVDWWHHPLVSQFMVNYLGKISCRLFIWSHISGCSYPYIYPEFISRSDAFVFSTPFSYENPYWTDVEREWVAQNSDVVVSSGIDLIEAVEKKSHAGFNVGYIGFLSYNKTHPDFVKYCESACDIPDIRFIVVGDTNYGEQLVKDAQKSETVRDKIMFTGYSLNVLERLKEFDVFGYPLNPEHYGTAENALLEAMGAGVVPIVLNQCTEKYIVQDMKTGLVVNSISEYANALKWLYCNPVEREAIGKNASEYVVKEYHIKSTTEKLNSIYEKTLQKNKKIHDLVSVVGKTPYEWFLSCYKGDKNEIRGNAFAETKGSAKHYLKYFSDDRILRKVVEDNESRIKTLL